MRLIVLGSGTCVPSLSRNAPGYLLVTDDFQVLVDCGEGTMKQLLHAGFSFQDIDAVFLSHYHPDHVSGLLPLLHALKSSTGFVRRKNLQVAGHLIPRECGLIGERAGVKKIVLTHMYPSPFPDDVRVRQCREVYTGQVLLAEDLMEVVV